MTDDRTPSKNVEDWGKLPVELLERITKDVHGAFVANIVKAFKEHEVDCQCETCKFLRVPRNEVQRDTAERRRDRLGAPLYWRLAAHTAARALPIP